MTAPMQALADPAASGGQYVVVNGQNTQTTASTTGSTTIPFTVPTDGAFTVWGRVVTVDLAAGAHTVTFAYREDGTQLDRVLITSDPTLVPTD